MSRIKKTGLDYFPLDIDFITNRFVRRIMKREGEGALATLINALSCIYGAEGYYVHADELFYEDLAVNLYNQTAADVKRILGLAVEYGIFHAGLFNQYGILTSGEIQKQYLFSTKRRKSTAIDPLYCIDADRNDDEEPEPQTTNPAPATEEATATSSNKCASEGINVTFKPKNVTSDTHSIAQHSIAQNSIEYPLLNSSPDGETQNADLKSAAEREAEVFSPPKAPRREWTEADIARLQPPADGLKRNMEGLINNLRHHRIPLNEQYAIILKSNFGVIGHPLWKGFYDLRESRGKIRFPGRYLLSLCVKARD